TPEAQQPPEPSPDTPPERLRKQRAPDPYWDALLHHFNPPQTDSERGKWNRAIKQLRDIGATPDEIHDHIAEHSRSQAFWQLSPLALVGNWTKLTPPQKVAASNGTDRRRSEDESPDEEKRRHERAAALDAFVDELNGNGNGNTSNNTK